ncbi:362_t:CDS:1, partial [Ambispora gerdemannii]
MKITFASALLLLAFTSISHAAPVGNGAAIGASASAPGSNANDVASGVPVDQVTGTANQVTDTGNNKATDTGDKVTGTAKGTSVSVKAAGVKLSVEHRSLNEVKTTVDGVTSQLGIKANDLANGVTNSGSADTGKGVAVNVKTGGLKRRSVEQVTNTVDGATGQLGIKVNDLANGETNSGLTDTVGKVE